MTKVAQAAARERLHGELRSRGVRVQKNAGDITMLKQLRDI
jgi:hypothetical protein